MPEVLHFTGQYFDGTNWVDVTIENIDQHYKLLDEVVTYTIDGGVSVAATYDAIYGRWTIPGSAITGDVEVQVKYLPRTYTSVGLKITLVQFLQQA